MIDKTDGVWKNAEFAKKYLDEIIGAIPFEEEQLDIMSRLIRCKREAVKRFLDIGCGNGILSSAILAEYPGARGVLLDFSQTMIVLQIPLLSNQFFHLQLQRFLL